MPHLTKALNSETKRIKADDNKEINIPIDGDRIVNLKKLIQRMFFCHCEEKLQLEHIVKEDVKALGSFWHIHCINCLKITKICSTKTYKSTVTGRDHFEVNSKVVLGKSTDNKIRENFNFCCIFYVFFISGALHTGIGHTQVNNELKIMGLPGLASRTFKNTEREVGNVIKNVAKTSCETAVQEERLLTIKNNEKILSLL